MEIGSSSGHDYKHETDIAKSTASNGIWPNVNNHDVGPNISFLNQIKETWHILTSHF